jgi:formyl-CoA transferase
VARQDLLADPRFANNSDRVKNRDVLKVELETALMRIDGAELADTLARAGLASGPIHNTAQVVAHPHTQHRQMIVEKEWYKALGSPIKLSRTPASLRSLPPKFGEHSREVLTEFGFEDREVDALLASGVVPTVRHT